MFGIRIERDAAQEQRIPNYIQHLKSLLQIQEDNHNLSLCEDYTFRT